MSPGMRPNEVGAAGVEDQNRGREQWLTRWLPANALSILPALEGPYLRDDTAEMTLVERVRIRWGPCGSA